MPPTTTNSHEPIPQIEERFVVKIRFKGKRPGESTLVRMLNADGHIDAAHKMGLISLRSEILERWIEETEQTNDESEKFISRTRWCIVKVTAQVRSPEGGVITVDGISCTNDRDKFVKQPGYEVVVAETRAIKRALANACNLTEKYISPDSEEPTRETVDMPLPTEEKKETPDLPPDMLRKPDITPPIDGIKQRDGGKPGEQFDFS
jgi:hypothetical protein